MIAGASRLLEAVAVAGDVLCDDRVTGAWEDPSALEGMVVGALAGHLVRASTTVRDALAKAAPSGDRPLLDAAGYFLSIEGLGGDLDSDLHAGIRARAAAAASDGPTAVLGRWRDAARDLARRLGETAPGRPVEVFGGRALAIEDYLDTRLIEVVVHTDDLAASVGLPAPAFAEDATGRVIACLVEIARRRHGDLAVIRAMVRRERDGVDALRVL